MINAWSPRACLSRLFRFVDADEPYGLSGRISRSYMTSYGVKPAFS